MTRTGASGWLWPAIYSGVFVGLLALSWLLPIVGVMAGVFAPAPLALLYRRHGRNQGRLGVLMGGVLAAAMMLGASTPGAGFYFLFYLGVGAALGESRTRGLADDAAVALAGGLGVGLILVLLLVVGLSGGVAPMEVWRAQWQAELDMFLAAYRDSGLTEAELASLRQGLTKTAGVLLKMAPGLLAASSLLIAWGNLMTVRRAQRGRQPQQSLTTWRAPELLVWPVIAGGVSLVLGEGWLYWAGANLLVILGVIYFFQGMAVMVYWLERKNAPPLLRTAVFVLVAVEPYLALVAALAGLFDMWFNLRRLGMDKPSDPEATP